MYSEAHCVYRAASIGEADLVVNWLGERDIAALVKDAHAAVTMQVPGIVAPAGIEVCVIEPDDADRARALLRDHFDLLDDRDDASESHGEPVVADCEDCGESATFPYVQRGSVQLCPHCGAYIDVPDPAAPEAGLA